MSGARSEEVAASVIRFLDNLQLAADHVETNSLRELRKDEQVTLRRAAKDLRRYGGPLVALLKDTHGALDMLAPVLSAARVIGWFSGPLEIGRPLFERLLPFEKAANMRAIKAAKQRPASDALDEAIKRYAGRGEKRAPVKEIARRVEDELGVPVPEQTVKHRLSKLRLVRRKTVRS
ncbi:MAG: hypothetical protein WB760_13510 [Xanthobacteraceae bacterium]